METKQIMSQQPQKVYVTKNQNASIFCDACEKTTTMDVSDFMGLDKAVRLKFKCTCGYSFSVLLERRSYVRKKVTFKGSLHFKEKKFSIMVLDIVVIDMSRFGLKIKLLSDIELATGQHVIVDFILDDTNGSKISKEVVIRNITPPHIGVEFLYHEHYDKFGTYILFHFGSK